MLNQARIFTKLGEPSVDKVGFESDWAMSDVGAECGSAGDTHSVPILIGIQAS